ncbi:MAG: Ig-like domain repeat protein, partial [Acidimicrobiales bacterium]
NPVDAGQSTLVTADLTHDQSDVAYLAHTVPDGTPVTFGGTAGSYPGGTAGATAGGIATDSMTGGTGGSYPAGASVTVDGVTVSTPVTVDAPPAITSAASTTSTVGTASAFTVTATGYPTPALSELGSLPTGVTFTDLGNGTASLSGTPASGTGGSYALTLSASNRVSPEATQDFTLTVYEAPAITSASNTTFTIGSAGTFTVTATHSYPAATISETGALPSGISFSSAGVFSGTPAADTAGIYSLKITVSNGVDTPDVQSFTLTVDGLAPTITWATPSAITYGTALSHKQLDAKASVPGTFAYSPPAGTVLGAGAQNLSVTFTPTNPLQYATAIDGVTLQVNQATPKITWSKPAAIMYGTPLGSTELDAGSSVPGLFDYGSEPGSILPVGRNTLSVTFTPYDSTDYTSATGQTTQVVRKATTAVGSVTVPSSVPYGPGTLGVLAVSVTSSTGAVPTGTVVFRSTETGSTTSNTLCKATLDSFGDAECESSVILSVGSYSVTASLKGSHDFFGSISASSSFQVVQVVTAVPALDVASVVTYGKGDLGTLSATVVSDTGPVPKGVVTFESMATGGSTETTLCHRKVDNSGLASCASRVALAPGTYAVVAVYAGSTNFTGSTSAGVALEVLQASTEIAPVSVVLPATGTNRVMFSATLTSESTGAPIAGQTIEFTLGTQSCSGVTDRTGIAHCPMRVDSATVVADGLTSYSAVFAGSADYIESAGYGPVTVG